MVLHTVGPAEKLPPDHGGLLVVDDEQFLRDAVAASLRFLGFEVTTAETAAEALRLARDRPFDLVVLDVMLLWLARLDQHPARQSDPVDLSALAADCVRAEPDRRPAANLAGPDHPRARRRRRPGNAVPGRGQPAGQRAHAHPGREHRRRHRLRRRRPRRGRGQRQRPRRPRRPASPHLRRFYRAGTPAQRPGSGLGLAIVTEIAAAHDGTVTAAPTWPRGLRLTLAVPAWQPSGSADARGSDREADRGPTEGPEILTTTELLQVWVLVSLWA